MDRIGNVALFHVKLLCPRPLNFKITMKWKAGHNNGRTQYWLFANGSSKYSNVKTQTTFHLCSANLPVFDLFYINLKASLLLILSLNSGG